MKRLFSSILLIFTLVINLYAQDWNQIKYDIKHSNFDSIINVSDSQILNLTIKEIKNSTFDWQYKRLYIDTVSGEYKHVDQEEFEKYKNDTNCLFIRQYKTMTNLRYEYKYSNKSLPTPIYNRYMFGDELMKWGWVNFSFGSALTAVGGIIAGVGTNNGNVKQAQIGYGLIGVGGTLLSVSLPLLCFGDNAKRQANVDYEMFNLMK